MSGSRTSRPGIPGPSDPSPAPLIEAWAARGRGHDHAAVLAALVDRVAAARGLDVALTIDGEMVPADAAFLDVEADPHVVDAWGPWLPGMLREALLDDAARAAGGVHHTAPAVADAVLDTALAVRGFGPDDVVLDPAVGGGAFLLAAAARMPGDPAAVVGRLRGVDRDPVAVGVAIAALRLWGDGAAVDPGAIRVGDGLTASWDDRVSWVVGNPPFLSQLRGAAVRDTARRRELRARWPELGPYTDDAAAFLLAGVDTVVPGGIVALVQPTSVLSARDTAALRDRLRRIAPPVAVWLDGGRRFDAAVDTVALVVRRDGEAGPVLRRVGVPPVAGSPVSLDDGSWAPLLLGERAPRLAEDELATSGRIGDVAAVTAGFRDQFYGLRGAVRDDPAGRHRLVTSGLIDPLEFRWGTVPCRFDRQRWDHPVVDVDAVAPAIADWVRARLRPKLLIASQTRTIEVAVDAAGTTVPCTPVVSVEPFDSAPSLDHLAAALVSPVATALLYREAAGSALSAEAMRVSASAIAALPLPGDAAAWDRAAELVAARRVGDDASLDAIGRAAMAAYGVATRSDVHAWWQSRRRRR